MQRRRGLGAQPLEGQPEQARVGLLDALDLGVQDRLEERSEPQPVEEAKERAVAVRDGGQAEAGPPEPLLIVSPFSTSATLTPFLAALMAAQHPAMPPPMTKTSVSISYSFS